MYPDKQGLLDPHMGVIGNPSPKGLCVDFIKES